MLAIILGLSRGITICIVKQSWSGCVLIILGLDIKGLTSVREELLPYGSSFDYHNPGVFA
jgi:hypothetical protein